jgi:hypothetical protein
MATNLGKAAVAAVVMGLTPVALTEMSGRGSEALAHTIVQGHVAVAAPSFVVGFSYGDPFFYGHVHHYPVACAAGPIYYYPYAGVYGHHHSHARFVRYARPVRFDLRHHSPRYYHHYAVRGFHPGHGHGHGKQARSSHSRGHGRHGGGKDRH